MQCIFYVHKKTKRPFQIGIVWKVDGRPFGSCLCFSEKNPKKIERAGELRINIFRKES